MVRVRKNAASMCGKRGYRRKHIDRWICVPPHKVRACKHGARTESGRCPKKRRAARVHHNAHIVAFRRRQVANSGKFIGPMRPFIGPIRRAVAAAAAPVDRPRRAASIRAAPVDRPRKKR